VLSFEPVRAYASPAQNYPQTVAGARAIGLDPLLVDGTNSIYDGERPAPYATPDVDKLTNRLIAPNVYDNPYVDPLVMANVVAMETRMRISCCQAHPIRPVWTKW